jgi:2Fe-2S ferredoxin
MELKDAIVSAVMDDPVMDEPVKDEHSTEIENRAHRVTFIRPGQEPVTVEYEPGVTPYQDHGKEGSFLDIALNCGIDLQHACGGNCACTTCHVIIKEGEENVSEMEDDEEDRLYLADGLTLHSRLGCQAVVRGDVTVEIPD